MLGLLGGWKGLAKSAGKLAAVLVVAWVAWDYIDTKIEEQRVRQELSAAKAQARLHKAFRDQAEEARDKSQADLRDLRRQKQAARRDARLYRQRWEDLQDENKELREWAGGGLPGHVADRMRDLAGPGPGGPGDEGEGGAGGPPGRAEAGASGGPNADP